MSRKVKELGQVYTPQEIVRDVLDAANYNGNNILKKHIMENSCGPGAFLVEIAKRYIDAFLDNDSDLNQLKNELQTYIHAIDIDSSNVSTTTERLNELAQRYGLSSVIWDIRNEDTLKVKDYDGKMDFVVGNPPYVRVHNLEDSYDSVKEFSFAQEGMTDIYIVFFEIGLNMLKKDGVLSYITASSYYNSLAGTALRNYISRTHSLYKIMDLGHYNPFEEVTYTTITCFKKNASFDSIDYYSYDLDAGRPYRVDTIPYSELFVDGNIVLMEGSESRKEFAAIYAIDRSKHREVVIKNGFATLADKVFISDDYKGMGNTIKIYKGSTGKWTTCIYPYDANGKLIPFNQLDPKVQKVLESHKDQLNERDLDGKSEWYSFGRTQAINDVYKDKIAINALLKDVKSIKIEMLPAGTGTYSGVYILSDFPLDDVKDALCSEEFVKYIKAIKKYKNGGYYTFSTTDVNKYLLYKLCNIRNKQSTLISFKDTQRNVQPC
jgi:adenine-specific DNA-methyltransferase